MNRAHRSSLFVACVAAPTLSYVSLAFALALALGGCGNRAADCAYLCERAATCTDGVEQLGCSAACLAMGTTGGLTGRTAISQCASCVAGASCAQIGNGQCANACRGAGVDLSAIPSSTSPSSSSASSSSADGGAYCEWHGRTATSAVTVRCRNDASSIENLCTCFEDGISSGTFWTVDFCNVDAAAEASRAARGCHFTLANP